MKPKDTHYNGYRFRSRLEARWAVFFDTFGVPYQYEKEGYVLDGISYLPDFWLPLDDVEHGNKGWGYWLEIKPVALTMKEELLLEKLVEHTGHNAYAFAGNPWRGEYAVSNWMMNRATNKAFCAFKNQREFPYDFALFSHWDLKCNFDEALKAARSARFEHGEKGI